MGRASRTSLTSSSYLVSLLAASFTSTVRANDLPKVDYDRMGVVALGGAFTGLDFYAPNSTNTFDTSSSTLLSRAANGTVSHITTTNNGGSIKAVCTLGNKIYVAGNFSSLSSSAYANVAVYDPSSSTFSALQSGLDDTVYTLFCDTATNKVWAGGDFKAPIGAANPSAYGGSVAVFDTKASAWSPPGFGGLTGQASTVRSITPGVGSASSTLYCAGSFLTTYGTNTTVVVNNTNNPNVPYSSGASPFSSALVPIPLNDSEVNANPSSSESGFSDIRNILCPSGPDGPGNTWFSADDQSTQITIRTNQFQNARGLRLGNTFISGHGTQSFEVTALPGNQVLQLTYINPVTFANETCSTFCPLLSNSSVPYQDFIFDSSVQLTGVQVTLSQWTGSSAGLHLIQLLSDGAFASAIPGNNGRSCYSPEMSGAIKKGDWTEFEASTSIPGTVQTVLRATVPVGTSSASSPSLTWSPYISASGYYNIYVYVPGCIETQDCPSRTSVDITVNPGGGAAPQTTTVSEAVDSDTRTLIYTGFVQPSPPSYTLDIQLALSSKPTGKGVDGQYSIIADRVQLELISIATNGSSSNGGSPWSVQTNAMGFGFWEWNTNTAAGSVNATGTVSNSTETPFDTASTQFASDLGGSVSGAMINSGVATGSNQFFMGGYFTSNASSNIVSFVNGSVAPLAGGGLNGTVTALAYANGTLYVGGSFGGVNGANSPSLKYVAQYNIASNSWSSVGSGLNGPVNSISVSNGQLVVAGNFSETYSDGDAFGVQSGGVATYDTAAGKWVTGGGLVLGKASLVVASNEGTQYIAGNFASASGNSAAGWSLLTTDKSGDTSFSGASAPLSEAALEVSSNAATTPIPGRRRSSSLENSKDTLTWLVPRLLNTVLSPRDTTVANESLPNPPPAPAPAVLAIGYWTNETTSREIIVLGGNFSFTASGSSTPSSGIALYDQKSQALNALKGDQINGTVNTLFVKDHSLYVGGEFTVGSYSGFAVYDVNSLAWQSNLGAISSSGGTVVVRSISSPPTQTQYVIVAGTFSEASFTTCNAICAYDTSASKWTQLGSGIQGQVAVVDFATEDKHDVAIVAGSLSLQDGTPANVAKYFFSNSSWIAVGAGIPGPVTAMTTDDGNINSIYAAGRTSDGSTPFVLHWNGQSWSSVGGPLNGDTVVSQLSVVPLVDQHSANSILSQDRMLLVSGALTSSSFNVSSALYDGQSWYPYITSIGSTGAAGFVAGLYHSFTNFSFNQRHVLAAGVVILISIAIAAGIVFFLLLIGVLWTLLSRDSPTADAGKYYEQEEEESLNRPSSLLEHINAATRSAIVGGAGGAAVGGAAVAAASTDDNHGGAASTDAGHVDADGWRRSETPAVAAAAGLVGSGQEPEEEVGRPAFARYSFDGEGEGELQLQTGAQLAVLDDRDPSWWYVRDEQTGREGIVPAAYLY